MRLANAEDENEDEMRWIGEWLPSNHTHDRERNFMLLLLLLLFFVCFERWKKKVKVNVRTMNEWCFIRAHCWKLNVPWSRPSKFCNSTANFGPKCQPLRINMQNSAEHNRNNSLLNLDELTIYTNRLWMWTIPFKQIRHNLHINRIRLCQAIDNNFEWRFFISPFAALTR